MLRNKHTERTLIIRGVGIVDVVTAEGFAKMVGKSKSTILRYERNDVLPLAPIMQGTTRYYPISLVRKVSPYIKGFPMDRKPSAESVAAIHRFFQEEKERLLCQK